MKIAIVTGASSGMGRDFVREIDKQQDFDEIWVIARRKERLESLAGEIRSNLRAIPLDLTQSQSIKELDELLREFNPNVAVLVNASGYGRFGAFRDISLEDSIGMIDLNSTALMAVTYTVLPYMQRGAQIYELCSLSSFQPVPYICVYGATKSFVLSFSRALNRELKPRGIRVMAVSPGWVQTEFFDRAATDNTISYYNRIFKSEDVVKRAIKDMKKGKDVSVLGASIRLQVLAIKLLPHKLVMNVWCKQQKKP